MVLRVVKSVPRLLKTYVKFNHAAIVHASTSPNASSKVIESEYKPSGAVPHDESYFQIPIKVNGTEYVVDNELLSRNYPFVPTLEAISIEKVENSNEAQVEEIEPEHQIRTLEDKCKVWFGQDMPTKFDDQNPERDLVNYPRLPPQMAFSPPTRMYFLPESWFKFFEEKTGRTGGYVFGTTFMTYLLSKEILCYNDNAHIGLSMSIIFMIGVKLYGKQMNETMLSTVMKEKQGWIDWQDGMKKLLKDHVVELKQIENRSLNPEMIYDAKRESLALQQEAEYRRRLMQVYNEVKRKLDYQVAIEEAKKTFTRKHLINWVIENVNKGVNADLEKAVLKQCIGDLKLLSEKRRNAV